MLVAGEAAGGLARDGAAGVVVAVDEAPLAPKRALRVVVGQALDHRGRTDTARLGIDGISAALDLYHLDMGRYPNEQEGLVALAERPASGERWRGPYVRKRDMLNDPWGRPYRYRLPGRNGDYDLFSYGADDAEGGTGDNQDVTSW